MMMPSMRSRIITYAIEHRHIPMWKSRLYGALYGAGIPVLSRVKS